MLLAIDIGNTNVVIGVFTEDSLLASWRVETDLRRMPDEYGALLGSLFELAGLERGRISSAIICSVVPSVEVTVCEAVRRYWQLDALVVSPELDTGVPVRYSPKDAVGPDRIANAAATIERYGAPAIVVDFGTATTFDAISAEAEYVGGAIAPGLEIGAEALFSRTARLRPVPLEEPSMAIGVNTTESLQSGILYGYAGLVDGLVGRFQRNLGTEAPVIATGGLAPLIAPLTRTVQHVDPDLTLVGLRLIHERHAQTADGVSTRQNQSLA